MPFLLGVAFFLFDPINPRFSFTTKHTRHTRNYKHYLNKKHTLESILVLFVFLVVNL